MLDLNLAKQQYDSLLFWDGVAEVYDTFGLPKDLILVRLRESGFELDESRFIALMDYMVGRRNKSAPLIEWETFTRDLLIIIPKGLDWEVVTDA